MAQDEEQLQKEKKFYRELLIKGYYSVNLSYDRDVLTIAGGALTLFAGFIYKIVDFNSADCVLFMKIAWFSLVISMLLIVFRHYAGIKSHNKTLEQLDKGKKNDEPTGGMWTAVAEFCFVFSAIFLCLGLILAMIFISKNVGR